MRKADLPGKKELITSTGNGCSIFRLPMMAHGFVIFGWIIL
jgi:hypothetical protein